MKQMTAKRARFVQEYLVDMDVQAALKRAGFKLGPNSTYGWKLLKMPLVARAIQDAMDERARATKVTAAMVIGELLTIAFSDIGRVATWKTRPGPDGEPITELCLKDSDEIAPSARAAIAKVRRYTYGAVQVEMHDKLAALALLGKHLGMFVNRHEIAGPPDDSQAVAQMRDRFCEMTQAQRDRVRSAIRTVLEEIERETDSGK